MFSIVVGIVCGLVGFVLGLIIAVCGIDEHNNQ